MTHAGFKGRCFVELKSALLEVGYIEKWPKFAYLESKVPHLKFRVMRDRVYLWSVSPHDLFAEYKRVLIHYVFRKEIKEGGEKLKDKIKQYQPKIAVFNGKGIYEVFSGNKKFNFGKQPNTVPGTDTVRNLYSKPATCLCVSEV